VRSENSLLARVPQCLEEYLRKAMLRSPERGGTRASRPAVNSNRLSKFPQLWNGPWEIGLNEWKGIPGEYSELVAQSTRSGPP